MRQDWLQAVDQRIHEVQEWAHAAGWKVTRSVKDMIEASTGPYSVPTLEIDTGDGTVTFEPIGRDVIGATGRIDLSAWPSLYRVMLVRRQDGSWVVRTDSGINWPHPWGSETFIELSRSLANAR